MVFSSIIFLFFYLPIVLLLYYIAPNKMKNFLLLVASLFFYAWGEGVYIILMLFVVFVNYFVALQFERGLTRKTNRIVLIVGIVLNLLPLIFFKYSAFFYHSLSPLLGSVLGLSISESYGPHLPLGISFFTFQALSYLIDTYRRTSLPQKNPINLALYIALFPQLIAGPIVRYHDVSKQILKRRVTIDGFSYGIERFVLGLGKKVLLANPLGQMADLIFTFQGDQLTMSAAWLGVLCYSLQIFFDFSGYSDMAIGLGRMFGFTFLENFNYPYVAKSIQDFWRRWHISLSNWFRDYLYIPLGGNRKGDKRTIINLFIVFLLCGFWHGASWNFIVWGMFHGLFLALERGRFGSWLKGIPTLLQHVYALLVVMVGWVYFRTESLAEGWRYLTTMFFGGDASSMPNDIISRLDLLFITTLLIGVLVAILPLFSLRNMGKVSGYVVATAKKTSASYQLGNLVFLMAIFVFSIASLANGSYNPFIYFRF